MIKLTKAQVKDRDRITAWLEGKPFRESSREKSPQVPVLSTEEVLNMFIPPAVADAGQFFTPLGMGRDAVGMLSFLPGFRVLEPSAGIGHLIYHMPAEGVIIDAYELHHDCAKVGQKLFPFANWHDTSPFENTDELVGQYDLVVANPPFGIKWGMYEAEIASANKVKRSEHLFMELITQALKLDGLAVVIAPEGLISSMPKKMSAWFNDRMAIESQWHLGNGFKMTNIHVDGFVFRRI